MDPVTLTDGDLTLTPPTPGDIPVITAACQDPLIATYTTVPQPYTAEHAREFVEERVPAGWETDEPVWAIRRDEALVGMIDLHGSLHGSSAREVGYWVAPEARRQGSLSRALPLVLDAGFGLLGLERLEWSAAADNWASWRAAWRQGFRREGTLRAAFPASQGGTTNGRPRDLWVASLLPTDPRAPAAPWDGPETTAAGTPSPAIPDPRDPEALVRQFHATYGLPVASDAPSVDRDRVHMRMALIAEEFAELVGAVYGDEAEAAVLSGVAAAVAADDGSRDTIGAADALADLVYVIYGMALECAIPLDAVLRAVQRSNLSKLGADGQPIYREDGKVLKGPGFFEPAIAEALAAAQSLIHASPRVRAASPTARAASQNP